jgi:hypothetical protein
MVQFGIKAMQPISPGQNLLGHLGNAVGGAGEAKRRVVEGAQDAALKKAQTDYYSGRSTYYANKGALGGLTANQVLMQQWRENLQWKDIFNKNLLLMGYDISTLTPEERVQLEEKTNDEFLTIFPERLADVAAAKSGGTLATSSVAPAEGTKYSIGDIIDYPDGRPSVTLTAEGWVPL